ncbi:SPARC-related modular calcium-binding protein 2-like isoform X2 [Antedon mediterranea]|uniref:SPARC-related modular calcium-binding protein 2-like isoform X2 n=1 Tax=Antedon mediterranea TaxID=105859 RepID=UPI003AF997E8
MDILFRHCLPLTAIIFSILFMEHACEARLAKFPIDRVTNPSCNSDCTDAPKKLLCGSDGLTYNSRCQLQYAKCIGKQIAIIKKGKCVEKTKCQAERESSISVAAGSSSTNGVFIPQCNLDGTYSSTQCHSSFNYCWCVDDLGKPIPGTSVQYRRPTCDGESSPGSCSQTDRAEFNTNLRAKFQEEYNRLPALETSNHIGDVEMRVIQWKFNQLDLDKNDEIKLSEIKSLQRMLKKFVKPKKCAKTFFVHCSSAHNGQITRKAWSQCLGLATSMIEKAFWMLSPSPSGSKAVAELRDTSDEEKCCKRPLLEEVNSRADDTLLEKPEKTTSPPDDYPCNVERADALAKEKQAPERGVFIPRCIGSNYDPIQCHKEAKYCWCVNVTTGHPISGTSLKVDVSIPGFASTLNCNQNVETSTNKVDSTPAPAVFKGCTGNKQAKFLNSIMDMLITEMMGEPASSVTQKDSFTDASKSVTERVARWKFLHMDANSNNAIDKREQREFKSQLDDLSARKKCKKNFIPYCDNDNDSRLTMDEWLSCLGIKNTLTPTPTSVTRRGKNPFSILS